MLWLVLLVLLVMMRVSGSVRTSPPAPPPPGMGVTSSPFEPLWGPAPPAFFGVDTNGTFLAKANLKDDLKHSCSLSYRRYTAVQVRRLHTHYKHDGYIKFTLLIIDFNHSVNGLILNLYLCSKMKLC